MKPYQATVKVIIALFILFFTNTVVKAQDDSLALPYPQMLFSTPNNIGETIEYSLENGEFVFQKKIGSINIERPRFMSELTYRQWLFNQQIKNYWRQKVQSNLFDQGIAVLTLGNHAWDQREMLSYIEECPKIVRAINYPKGVPGKGEFKIILNDGRSLIVIQTMLRLFMGMNLDDPFAAVANRLSSEYLGTTCNGILIDLNYSSDYGYFGGKKFVFNNLMKEVEYE